MQAVIGAAIQVVIWGRSPSLIHSAVPITPQRLRRIRTVIPEQGRWFGR